VGYFDQTLGAAFDIVFILSPRPPQISLVTSGGLPRADANINSAGKAITIREDAFHHATTTGLYATERRRSNEDASGKLLGDRFRGLVPADLLGVASFGRATQSIVPIDPQWEPRLAFALRATRVA